jgi:hypothetical protein
MLDDTKPVNFTLLRDLLVCGANNPQGARLTVYESHYLLQLVDMLSQQASHQFNRIVPALDRLDEERRTDDLALADRDARSEKD